MPASTFAQASLTPTGLTILDSLQSDDNVLHVAIPASPVDYL